MNTNQSPLTIATRHGNLFINLIGEFGPKAANALVAGIQNHYPGRGNIFINTEKLADVLPAGRETFCGQLPALRTDNLYFIGTRGFELSPEGGRVIIRRPKKKSCKGCRNCSCKEAGGAEQSQAGSLWAANFRHS